MADHAGIEVRHARSCKGRELGGRCDCTPTFQAHVWDNRTRKRVRKPFSSASAAKRWREDAVVALRRGELSADRGLALNTALDQWIATLPTEHTRSGLPYKPGTMRDYERTIRRYGVRRKLGHLRVREVRTQDAQAWIDEMVKAGKLAPATIDTAVAPLKAFYRRALVRGEATINPFASILKPAVRAKVRQVASPVEAAAMLAALEVADRRLWARVTATCTAAR